MVIVQYRTKGFLRGGIGDEVPIQTLAGRGSFILSVDNLTYEDIVGRSQSIEQLVAAFNDDFRGRRSIISAIALATRRLIDKGLIDPQPKFRRASSRERVRQYVSTQVSADSLIPTDTRLNLYHKHRQ